jgi:acyl-CoA thioester hydrolase
MARRFKHRTRVRYSDCDPQGVVFFANHLGFFDIAMTELWREAIGPYDEMVAGGVDMVVAEANVRYRGPVPFDAEVELSAEITRLGQTGMTTRLELSVDGELRTEGELRHVFVEVEGGAKTEIPAEIRRALEPYMAEGATF